MIGILFQRLQIELYEIKDSKLFSYDGNYEYFLEKTQSHKKI